MDDNRFGAWLDEQIRRSGASRKEVADALGLAEGTIHSWIGGQRHISERNADEVANFFGVSRNTVREMANRPTVSGMAPGIIGLRGGSGVKGVASVVFIPVIGVIPPHAPAELGEMMPFAAEYVARFSEPGIVIVGDDRLVHRGIQRGEGLLIEQDVELAALKEGSLLVIGEGNELVMVELYADDEEGFLLMPVTAGERPRRYVEGQECEVRIVGLVRNIYSIRGVE